MIRLAGPKASKPNVSQAATFPSTSSAVNSTLHPVSGADRVTRRPASPGVVDCQTMCELPACSHSYQFLQGL